jgi:hypothetical protein
MVDLITWQGELRGHVDATYRACVMRLVERVKFSIIQYNFN